MARGRQRTGSWLTVRFVVALALVVPAGAAAVPAGAGVSAGTRVAVDVGGGPNPVVLVAGTFSPAAGLGVLAARLRADGHDVTVFELPDLGRGDIPTTSAALAPVVERVRARTGAERVDLVGHSQGGLVAREYVKTFGGAPHVDKVIGLGAPNHGTLLANLAVWFGDCLTVVACRQMAGGSEYLTALNDGDHSVAAVRYWQLASKTDAVVVPYRTSFLRESDGAIVNVAVQDQCWLRPVGHLSLVLDGAVYSGIRQALAGEAEVALDCFAW